MSWRTVAGTFSTNGTTNAKFALTELNPTAKITHKLHVASTLGAYDTILGRYLLTKLGIIINFKEQIVSWDEPYVKMRAADCNINDHYNLQDPKDIDDMVGRLAGDKYKQILNAKYEKADLSKVIREEYHHLSDNQQIELLKLLTKYETLFDGTLGTWKGLKYNIDLKDNIKPYHSRPYSLPKSYEQQFRIEVEQLCQLGVLKIVNRSEWGAPTFVIPKKDHTFRFITNFW